MSNKIKAPVVYTASDYAGMSCENASFYYGYQVEDECGNWCFTAEIKGREDIIKIPFPMLRAKDQFDVDNCLLVGIGWVMTRYSIAVA